MANQIDDIVDSLIEIDTKKYINRFDISDGGPLDNVVPLVTDGFFGPNVVNVVCFDGPYDWGDISATKQRLIDTYDLFTKYELHLVIDADADDVKNGDVSSLDSNLSSLASELSAYGVTYHGKLNTEDLTTLMTTIYSSTFE